MTQNKIIRKEIVFSTEILPEVEKELQSLLEPNNDLVIHNDDVNTFDFVIDTLMEVCGHDSIQAEQCTMIIHYSGKCVVKTGPKDELVPMYKEILSRGLTAEIE